jgi:hypothetical protein
MKDTKVGRLLPRILVVHLLAVLLVALVPVDAHGTRGGGSRPHVRQGLRSRGPALTPSSRIGWFVVGATATGLAILLTSPGDASRIPASTQQFVAHETDRPPPASKPGSYPGPSSGRERLSRPGEIPRDETSPERRSCPKKKRQRAQAGPPPVLPGAAGRPSPGDHAMPGIPPGRGEPVDPAAGATSPLQALQTTCEAAKRAVVTIHAGREIGSGSFVGDRLVVTNDHVVKGARGGSVRVRTDDGAVLPGTVVGTDRQGDLALIRVSSDQSVPVLPLSAGAPQPKEPVCAIGSPFGQPGVVTYGVFDRFMSDRDIQSWVSIKPGNSGGPLINARGEQIGTNKGVPPRAKKGDKTSYATSSEGIRALISKVLGGGRSTPGALAPDRRSPRSQDSASPYGREQRDSPHPSRLPPGPGGAPELKFGRPLEAG